MLIDVITYFHTPSAFRVAASHSKHQDMLVENKALHEEVQPLALHEEAQPPAYQPLHIVDQSTDHPPAPAAPSTMDEAEWRSKLEKLERKVRKHNWTNRGDEAKIVESMRDLAASHSDPEVQAYWTRRADDFERAPDSDKKALLKDIGRATGLLLAAPFLITGAILKGMGTILEVSGTYLFKAKDIFIK
ncbi:hypothetical protein B0H16DRAFT_1482209 [Mycena metata]|uniref:Uncharacterized protein n=1 Tax=Mycena metata TaxID=1033252 RepID=A0AAD7GUW2_9AGAR|nr:hypothetical protein B0H16DRAFT_1482209 [Mycena metata]